MAMGNKVSDGNGVFKYGEEIILTKDPTIWKRFERSYGYLREEPRKVFLTKYNGIENLGSLQDDEGKIVPGMVTGPSPDRPAWHYPIELFTSLRPTSRPLARNTNFKGYKHGKDSRF